MTTLFGQRLSGTAVLFALALLVIGPANTADAVSSPTYWAAAVSETIQRADAKDTKRREPANRRSIPEQITVDSAGGRMY